MSDHPSVSESEESPYESTSHRPRKRQRQSQQSIVGPTSLQCQVCSRTYERADHLNRHLDSHRNERPFRCGECPAAFNRRDLLLRHQATHAKNAAQGQIGPNRSAERAVKACDACVLSKVKCDNYRPCQRCQKKGIACSTRSLTQGIASPVSHVEESVASGFPTPPDRQSPVHDLHDENVQTEQQNSEAFSGEVSDAQALLSLYSHGFSQSQEIPTFFEQIMVPEQDFIGVEPVQPPDLTMWMPEVEWLGEMDLFSNDFAPTVDQTLEAQQVLNEFFSSSENRETGDAAQPRQLDDQARRRHAIFKQSTWFWVPGRNQHAFSEHDGIMIDERNVDIASSPHVPCPSNIIIQDTLSPQARDRIFQLVSKTTQSQVAIPSFPSADCLDKLIKVGIAKRTETDAWIHPFTFDSESSRPEFLTALVAAGCVCFGITSVSRTGLVLQEIVRVALNRLTEQDNSTIRDLQYLQASMVWLDIGAFCGYRRKMEVAESNLLPLVTGLRRAGKFDRVAYSSVAPHADDSDEENERKWRSWVEQESYKRLAYHLLEHDINMTMVKHRNPMLSYAEMTLPFPSPRSLWLAPSATIWRARWLSANHTYRHVSLRSLLKDDTAIRCLPPNVDSQIARSAYLHGLASQLWEHFQQVALVSDSSDASSQLWLRSRQQKLYQLLRNVDFSLETSPAISCVLHQFLKMYLHVNIDLITRFAGKCGEEAANRAYTQLQPWSQTKEARTAIWHAGQVIRAAREIPPYQIRGADSFIVYHSIMVLWTYSMIMRDRARRTGTTTPVRPTPAQQPSDPTHSRNIVFLDASPASNQSKIDAFILMDAGSPALKFHTAALRRRASNAEGLLSDVQAGVPTPQQVCDLRFPGQVMKVGVQILEASHPDVEPENGPPLSRALSSLMKELGSLR